MEKVLYEELRPEEFTERLANCPVAYLPLGTLEWHGPHLPLGADGLQASGLFRLLAEEIGGIVLPMLFLGPDFRHKYDPVLQQNYYGMDVGSIHRDGVLCDYPDQQLPGSAYYITHEHFKLILHNILFQLKRAGFKIVVAHGHGPSSHAFAEYAPEFEKELNIKCLDCITSADDKKLPFQIDHAAANETSITLALRPELVRLEALPADLSEYPTAIIGKDPRIHASVKYGNDCLKRTAQAMKTKILLALGNSKV